MEGWIEGHRRRWAFYRIPEDAQAVFRRVVKAAWCGDEDARARFEAAGVTDLMRPTVVLYDAVAAGLARPDLDDRTRGAIELALFGAHMFFLPADVVAAGSPEPPQASELIGEVLARGRADGLDDTQLAGGIAVVLESHGLLQRGAA